MRKDGYLSNDTIAALSTATGGALGIVRMSGPRALEILEKLARRPSLRAEIAPAAIFRAKLRGAGGALLDDGMAAYFAAPKSFTGEDAVELYLHGSAVVAAQVLEALAGFGARQALPGEFSFRAVRNGKMDFTQAEAVSDLIASANLDAAALALEKLDGAQSKFVGAIAEELRTLVSLSELGIDFADQDVEEVSLENLKRRLEPLRAKLNELEAGFERGKKIQEGVRAAFAGLPNAGKSSLFNALLGEDRSIVSEIAGTTRDVVRESLTLKGTAASVTLRLEDTAGLRATEDRVERIGVDRTVKAAREADFVVFLVDLSDFASRATEIEAAWRQIGSPSERAVAVLTKRDASSADTVREAQERLAALGIRNVFATSAVTREGVSEASRGIADFCARWTARRSGEVLLTRLDQVTAVRESLGHLSRALAAAGEDLFAADVRHALTSLGPVIGETPTDDILGRIFSQFCIGK